MELNNFENKSYSNGTMIKDKLHLDEHDEEMINSICETYPMLTNDYYLSLIDPDDPNDPIRKLSIPSEVELQKSGETDTSGEMENTVLPGVQHKYTQTLLVLSTYRCFMYCRHCFRKRMVGLTDKEINSQLNALPEYIKEHPGINNVLISGGDAFANGNEKIEHYLKVLTDLDQLDLVRFGTRAPVTYPQRITEDPSLVSLLEKYGEKKRIIVVTQFNHPREITPEAARAVEMLLRAGIVVKNQTVLLKGVNDDPKTLGKLLSDLTKIRVVPYYIFQCRPVRGVLNHFQVPIKRGCQIVDEAKALQNGQGKCVDYVMSHTSGKIEILGPVSDHEFAFKYHQAKYESDMNRIFTKDLRDDQCWLDD